MTPADELETITFESESAWEAWLERSHATSGGVWAKIAKKDSGIASVHYPEVLDAALCFGWIDGQRKAFDEMWFLQRFTPRRPRSPWSRVNREKAERLIAEGRMRPAGLAQVDAARADGRWDAAYESQSRITVPDDLRRELEAKPARGGVLRAAQLTEPLRNPLPAAGGQASGDAGPAAREVRRDARGGRDDPP